MEIYVVKIQDFYEEKLNKLCLLVTEESRNRIERFLRRQDKIRTLVGEVLIRMIACEKLNLRNDDIVFYKNPYGKPYLKSNQEFYFNISHSGDFVVAAIDNGEVGIDTEQVVWIEDYMGIAQKYFAEAEFTYIESGACDSLSRFYEIWTAKESYIKCTGKGLSIPLKSFSIKAEGGNIRTITDGKGKEYVFKQFNIDAGYKLTVCSLGGSIPDAVSIVNQNSL